MGSADWVSEVLSTLSDWDVPAHPRSWELRSSVTETRLAHERAKTCLDMGSLQERHSMDQLYERGKMRVHLRADEP